MNDVLTNSNDTLDARMDFDSVYGVFDALHFAFHPNGIGDEGIDERCRALFVLFLASSGWTEDEFWNEMDSHSDHQCDKCKAEAEEKAKTQIN